MAALPPLMPPVPIVGGRATLGGHLSIMRIDHWVKNVFVLPGIVVAISLTNAWRGSIEFIPLLLGLFATGLVASSNYVVNEVLDAPHDATHPTKRFRPVPSGRVNIPLAYVQWILLGVIGVGLGLMLGGKVAASLAALWVMGCIYNIRPIRAKDLPYLDVLTEAINNPLRMLIGWYLVTSVVLPPASMLISYWMIGCYFMGIKRYAELRHLLDRETAIGYRKSFKHYTTDRLLVSIMFYASVAMICFGAFIVRYRAELLLSFPLVALVMAMYLRLGFFPDSAAQNPEKLYKSRTLMAAVLLCAVAMTFLFLTDIPQMLELIAPTLPSAVQSPP